VPEPHETGLSVRFNLLKRTEVRFKSWWIDSSYLTSTDGFSFDLLPARREDGQRLELQPCVLSVNGLAQLAGRIDKTRVGHEGIVVTCDGRDYIADLVECNVDPKTVVAPETSLDDALLDCILPCGIANITDFENILFSEVRTGKAIQRKKRKRRKRPLQAIKPKPGEGIYEFVNRLVARQGATLQPTLDRSEIVIDAPDYTQKPSYTLTRTDDPNAAGANNIVRGEAERDYSRLPTHVAFTGMGGAAGEASAPLRIMLKMLDLAESFNSEMGAILKQALDPQAPLDPVQIGLLYRLLYHRDQEARTQEDLEAAAKRAIAERLKDTLAYTCTVKGHGDPVTGATYAINTMANVNDAVTGVYEPLWIAKRKLRYDETDGAMTDLELWRPESFQIFSEE
jgi:prophage tail gpP-like protein